MLQIPSIRRGGLFTSNWLFCEAVATAGSIASKSGNEIPTPTPRRNVRRVNDLLVNDAVMVLAVALGRWNDEMANAARIALSLFTEEQITGDNFGNDRFYWIMVLCKAIQDLIDLDTIAESHGGTGRVDG